MERIPEVTSQNSQTVCIASTIPIELKDFQSLKPELSSVGAAVLSVFEDFQIGIPTENIINEFFKCICDGTSNICISSQATESYFQNAEDVREPDEYEFLIEAEPSKLEEMNLILLPYRVEEKHWVLIVINWKHSKLIGEFLKETSSILTNSEVKYIQCQ